MSAHVLHDLHHEYAHHRAVFTGVPAHPDHFMGRSEVLRAALDQLTGVHAQHAIAFVGINGIGKTTLATLLARHPRIHHHFPDGILWAGLGHKPDVMGALTAWSHALGLHLSYLGDAAERAEAIRTAIGERRLLLVIDDACQLKAAELLCCGGPNCAYVLTTVEGLLGEDFAGAAQCHMLPPLDAVSAYTLLLALAPELCDAEPQRTVQVAQATGGVPLALKLLAAYLTAREYSTIESLGRPSADDPPAGLANQRRRLEVALQRLGKHGHTQTALQEAIALSLTGLSATGLRAFRAMGVFAPKPATFSREAAEAVCGAVIGDDAEQAAREVDGLITRGLLEENDDDLSLGLCIEPVLASVARARVDAKAAARHRAWYLEFAIQNRDNCDAIDPAYPQIKFAWAHHPSEPALLEYAWALRVYQERRGMSKDRDAWARRCVAAAQPSSGARPKSTGTALGNIGVVYDHLGQEKKALAHAQQALEHPEDVPMSRVSHPAMRAATLLHIGAVYDNLGQPTRAVEFYARARALHEVEEDPAGMAAAHQQMGVAYRHLEQYDEAIAHTRRAAELHEETGNRNEEAIQHYELAILHRSQGQLTDAVQHLRHAVEIDRLIESLNLESDEALLRKLEAELAGTALPSKRKGD
jgi:tetratricopeptide (TPR) repeat protein